MNGLSIDLKNVSLFVVVQADGPETAKETIADEKEFKDWKEAFKAVNSSEAPIKYVRFYHEGGEYKIYPIEDTEEFTVIKNPIMN